VRWWVIIGALASVVASMAIQKTPYEGSGSQASSFPKEEHAAVEDGPRAEKRPRRSSGSSCARSYVTVANEEAAKSGS
jgi:hypothetical protein